MNKLFTGASFVLAVMLAACGDNGVRSPDFDAQLVDIIVEGPSQAATDQFVQMRALGHFTTPPSQQGAQSISDITTDVDWSIVQPTTTSGTTPEDTCRLSTIPANDKATVNANGVVHTLAVGTVYVKATQKGGSNPKSGCKPFTIVPGGGGGGGDTVVLQGLKIVPDEATIPTGGDQTFHVQGIYSDAPTTPRDLNAGTAISWTSSNTSAATITVVQGNSSTAIAHGAAMGDSTITASTTNSAGTPVSDTAVLHVTAATVKTLLRVEPPSATVVVSFGAQYVACGTFSDGSVDTTGPCSANPSPDRQGLPAGHVITNADLDWTSSDHAVADDPVANTASSVLATGKAVGDTTITATLKTNHGDPLPAQRSATAALHVIAGPLCVPAGAILANYPAPVPVGMPPKASVDDPPSKGPLCLACTIDNPNSVIDAPPAQPPSADETFAEMSVTLSALDLLGLGYIDLTVHAKNLLGLPFIIDATANVANPAHAVGFIIERPAGDLATADVLGQASIITSLGGVQAQDFSSSTNGGSDTLSVDLLGAPVLPLGIPANERFILYSDAVTKPFDTITLRFGPGVASALTSLDVYNVCADVQVAPPPP